MRLINDQIIKESDLPDVIARVVNVIRIFNLIGLDPRWMDFKRMGLRDSHVYRGLTSAMNFNIVDRKLDKISKRYVYFLSREIKWRKQKTYTKS